MRLLNAPALLKFAGKHRDATQWLNRWMNDVDAASWGKLGDVRKIYPSADGVSLGRNVVVTVFNVKGNEYRLLTRIDYVGETVLVLDVMTHAEYTRNAWKMRW